MLYKKNGDKYELVENYIEIPDDVTLNILRDNEVNRVLSMANYWEEVLGREDNSPLSDELRMIIGRLGTAILFILAEYAELQKAYKEQEKI